MSVGDDQRLGGLKEFLKESSQYEKAREKFLKPFLEEQKRQSQSLLDTSKNYQQWQIEVYNREMSRERARLRHLQQQMKAYEKSKKTVNVTELEELGLDSATIRVDWSKRKFAPKKETTGNGSGYSPPPPTSAFPASGEPEFASPPPDYFESDAPPPPPPPELFYPESGNFASPPPVEDFVPPPSSSPPVE